MNVFIAVRIQWKLGHAARGSVRVYRQIGHMVSIIICEWLSIAAERTATTIGRGQTFDLEKFEEALT
ncbi:MAG: hypothetical protein LBH53_00870 [Puniceicoccales bacterium]|nr:hypothetical protein [Puniceicoccales bacterium]